MTVGVSLKRVVQVGTGSTATFYFNAPVQDDDNLAVYTYDTGTATQTLQTKNGAGTYDYTVTINPSTLYATITLNNNLPATHRITILRNIPLTQEVDYVQGDPFSAETHEGALDKLTLLAAQIQEEQDRSIKVIESSATTDLVMAELVAQKLLVVNNDATGIDMGPTFAEVDTVGTNITDVITVGDNITDVITVADDLNGSNTIGTVATNISNVNSVGTNISNVNSVAGNATNINTVAADGTDIGTVATNIANVNSVGSNIANVNSVASNATNINTVAADGTDIGLVAGSIANVNTAATDIANINTVAGNSTNINTVAGISTDVTTVATNVTDVTTFATTYLGAQASAPSTSVTGAIYYDTTQNQLYIWDGSAWDEAAFNTTGAVLSFNTRTGAITLNASDVNTALGSDAVLDSDIGVTVQGYDADTLKADTADTLTAPFRGTVTTDNDLSFDLNVTNNFKCTPSGTGALTFTNHTDGQSGFVWLDNSGGHAITAAATTKINATDLTAISTAGVYVLSYFDNGTNAYVMVSRSFA